MPQLIAMVIVVVGAMIYMFQTFGGTGDKIEGVAQKASVITEINNIKAGVKFAAKAELIEAAADGTGDTVKDLKGLANMAYFAEQINEQVIANTSDNEYNAISFGGDVNSVGGMKLALAPKAGYIPGIFVDLSAGTLSDNAGFLELQIATDLDAVATIDRKATSAVAGPNATATTGVAQRIPLTTTTNPGTDNDGKFIVYFKDFGASEVAK